MLQDEIDKLRELEQLVKPLPIYSPTRETEIAGARKLLDEGISQKGSLESAAFKIAKYLRFEGYEIGYAKGTLKKWLAKCSPNLYDVKSADRTIDKVCNTVYYRKFNLVTEADEIEEIFGIQQTNPIAELSDAELKDVLAVENKTLRTLYFILLRHCKVFGGEDRQFYMSYGQMSDAGAGKNRTRLRQQIEQLAQMGKIEIVQTNFAPDGRMKKSPNEYRIPKLI